MKVSVLITSYNHVHELRRAIDSVLSQKTSFEFEVIVVDDCSTDGSTEVLKEYYNKNLISCVQFKEHYGIMKTYLVGFQRCKGEYITLCDCDDYWINDNKLQLQVEYMDSNPNVGAAFTRAFIQEGNIKKLSSLPSKELDYNAMLRGGHMFSPTMILRASALENFWRIFDFNKFYIWDYPMYLYLSRWTKIGYLQDVTACYVKWTESFSNTRTRKKRLKYVLGLFKIKIIFISTYGCSWSTLGFISYRFLRDIYSVIFKRWYK